MISIAQNFGQGGARLPDQDVGGLRSLLTELQGFRVSFVEGSTAGSGDLVPAVTVDATNDTLLAAFAIPDGASAMTKLGVADCYLVAGSTNNFAYTDNLADKGVMVFWFDCDAG